MWQNVAIFVLGIGVVALLGVVLALVKRQIKQKKPKETEWEIEQSKQEQAAANRLQAMLNASPLACFILSEKLEVIDLNNKMITIFEAQDKQGIINNFFDLMPKHQPDGELSIERIKIVMAKLEKPVTFEWSALTLGGKAFPSKVYGVPFVGDGERAAIVYLDDLRERKETERVIMESRQELLSREKLLKAVTRVAHILLTVRDTGELDKAFDASLDMLCDTLNADRIRLWHANPKAETLGLSLKAERFGKVERNYISGDDIIDAPPDVWQKWERTFMTGGFVNGPISALSPEEQQFLNPNGIIKSLCIIPIFLSGLFWGFLCIDDCEREHELTKDELVILHSASLMIASTCYRTEQAEDLHSWLEEALDREQTANSAKSRFLSNMSHEIRTPMNAIIGMTDVARNTSNIRRKDECIEKIAKASGHLLGILNQILDMSRIEAEQFTLYSHPFDFRKMVDRVVSVLSVSIEENNLNFELELDETIPEEIVSDEIRFAQVLTNLLGNAIKFTPEGGKVSLLAKFLDERNQLCIEVADTGIGIPKEMHSKLFDDFMQVESDFSRKFTGTGLGLPISKQIVGLMGGEIWVVSELGEGARFIFTIPIQASDPDGIEVEESFVSNFARNPLGVEPGCFSNKTILIAEDVDINCEIVISILEPTGVVIDSALDGARALQMFEKNPERYDLILMDVQMPEIDGLTATRLIREIGTEKAMSIPIVALTANVFQEDIEACLNAGMNDHLSKPIDISRMMEKLVRYL